MNQFLGLSDNSEDPQEARERMQLYINLKLSSSGQPSSEEGSSSRFLEVANNLLNSYREKSRLLSGYLCPPDQRIQDFLNDYLADVADTGIPQLPENSIILDRHGVARELSLPARGNEFKNEYVSSYRLRNGVLNNPTNDRRTTKGSFHIAEGGLPIPGDKKAVPKLAFALLLKAALNPPENLQRLPFTSEQEHQAKMFVSLLLRPVVCPEIPGREAEKSMEIRFFAPGSLVSNLDFVESIFGNGGNPVLASNDAGLDVDHWSGHSGCVILAPHLVKLTKKELGLPHRDKATPRQIADGMYWQNENELYNDGSAFKITARDERGVIVTLLADNYYGYCKKEVKTQISYAANLFGLAEEEHAGGALAFPRHNHGEEFGVDSITRVAGYSFDETVKNYGELMHLQPQGYGIDKQYSDVIYVQQDLRMDLPTQTVTWLKDGKQQSIKLQPNKIYIQPLSAPTLTSIRAIQNWLGPDTWIRLKTWHLHHRNFSLDQALDVIQQLVFVDAHQRTGFTFAAGTSGTANAVYIILGYIRQFEIHYMRQFDDVDTARGDVGGTQHLQFAGFEFGQGTGTRSLALVAVYRHRGYAFLA